MASMGVSDKLACAARYVDQGGGKRKGAFALYLEPWHADVYDFIDLRKNHGKEEVRIPNAAKGLMKGAHECWLESQSGSGPLVQMAELRLSELCFQVGAC